MLFVAVREMSYYYFKTESEYEPGKNFLGGGESALQGVMPLVPSVPSTSRPVIGL